MKFIDKIDLLISKIKCSNDQSYLTLIRKKHIDLYLKNKFSFIDSPFIEQWNKKNLYNFFYQNEKKEKYKQEKILEDEIISYSKRNNTFLFVFINGKYNDQLIKYKYNKINYNIINLDHVFDNDKKIKNFYENLCYFRYNVFYSLNIIVLDNFLYINIPDNVSLEKPIEILHYYNNNESIMINSRILIIVGKNSNVKIIENYKFIKKNYSFINIVNDLYASNYSKIDYFKVQNNIKNSYFVDNTNIKQKKGSECKVYTFSLQGEKIKNNLNFFSNGEKTKSNLYGISLLYNKDSIYHSTSINHLFSNSYSNQLYKNILFGNSNGIFDGKIFIDKNIKKINAFQKNENILISKRSNFYSKPQLEIYSKDVKCSHGCTIGHIQKSELFYLKSRGISEKEGNILLLFSFLNDIFKSITLYNLKKIIQDNINKKLNEFL
ncbi:SufB/SufD family protein [Blattabacterium cuenoti]|uniref:SufB/SufD family protein n=1 Tax=Blattabacterium cuenoti TaxID=1653831 RepID=UPI00163D1E3E|nr:SufD family Fe-S cluster assembly protein [Blattabacterium cuenoti]